MNTEDFKNKFRRGELGSKNTHSTLYVVKSDHAEFLMQQDSSYHGKGQAKLLALKVSGVYMDCPEIFTLLDRTMDITTARVIDQFEGMNLIEIGEVTGLYPLPAWNKNNSRGVIINPTVEDIVDVTKLEKRSICSFIKKKASTVLQFLSFLYPKCSVMCLEGYTPWMATDMGPNFEIPSIPEQVGHMDLEDFLLIKRLERFNRDDRDEDDTALERFINKINDLERDRVCPGSLDPKKSMQTIVDDRLYIKGYWKIYPQRYSAPSVPMHFENWHKLGYNELVVS